MHRLHSLTQLVEHPDAFSFFALTGLVVVCLAGAYLLSRVNLTVLVLLAVFLQMFSGNWGLMGIPVPLDRVVLAFTLVTLLLKGSRHVGSRRIVLRPLHLALLSAATWAGASGIIAGTLSGHLGFFAYLDRFGLVPFLMFCLAPVFFGTAAQRRLLLAALVVMGLYLGLTGCLEGIHLYKLIFPRYIANPNVGIQWGRARGPILESTGNGFCVFVSGAAALIGLRTWASRRTHVLCFTVVALDLATLFFTLTRGVWIGTFVGIVATMMLTKRTRRVLVPTILSGIILVGATLAVSPTVRTEVLGRTESQSPVWDRENTDLAALRIVEKYPLTGVGWENFVNVSQNYIRQQSDVPITGVGLEVHNVFLSHAAELGIPGLMLWLLAFLGAVRRGLLPRGWRRRSTARDDQPDLVLWRFAGFAIVLCFFVIADLAPFSQALPNTLLWTWLGVLATPYTSRPLLAALEQRRASRTTPLALPLAAEEPPTGLEEPFRPAFL